MNTLPDFAGDAATGVRGLPHRLGPRGSIAVGFVTMAAATAVLALDAPAASGAGTTTAVVAASAVVLGVALAALTGRLRAAWSLTLAAAVLNVAILLTRGGSLSG